MAEKKKRFDLGNVLADVSGAGTEGRKQLEYIDISLIYPDPNNREIKNIQEIADSIAMNGLSAPLDLRLHPEIEGAYMVVSGHRRRAGLLVLVEEDPEKWRKVPCIVDRSQRSDAEWRLKLLDANMQTQELTDAELAANAAEMTDLIYQLKEEGHEFPGRVRDWVAEKCKLSKSKLSRLKVIQDKLVAPKFVEMWKAGELKEDPAHALAQMPALMQEAIAKHKGPLPSADVLRKIQERGMDHYLSTSATCKSGEGCTNGENFLRHDLAVGGAVWNVGRCKCCVGCYEGGCKFACRSRKEKDKEEKAITAKAKEKAQAQAAAAAKTRVDFTTGVAKRLLAASGGQYEVFAAVRKELRCSIHDLDCAVRAVAQGGKVDAVHAGYWLISLPDLVALCRQLSVSADYLLGLADDPLTQMAEGGTPTWRPGNKPPERPGVYWCKFVDDPTTGTSYTMPAEWYPIDRSWCLIPLGEEIEDECLGWYPIPDGEAEEGNDGKD